MSIQSEQLNKMKVVDDIRHRTNEREAGLWEFRFKGKPEGTAAVTLYPNLLAEIVTSQLNAEVFADAANVSYPVFAAVVEDGERLTWDEMNGIRKRLEWSESGSSYRLRMDYLLSPKTAFINPLSRKGKILHWKFETAKEAAFSCGLNCLSKSDRISVIVVERLFNEKVLFRYSAFRKAMNILERVVRAANSLKRERAARHSVRRGEPFA